MADCNYSLLERQSRVCSFQQHLLFDSGVLMRVGLLHREIAYTQKCFLVLRALSGSRVGYVGRSHAPETLALGLEYGKALVARIKELLARLGEENRLNEEKVHWY